MQNYDNQTAGTRKPLFGRPPTTIPIADPVDGLLQRRDLGSTVTVRFPTWPDAVEGDYYQLLINNILEGEQKQLRSKPTPGEVLSLEFFISDRWGEGAYTLAYMTRRFIGGTPIVSPPIPFIIDRTPPGGDTLAPLMFPSESDNGLTSAELAAMGNVLVASVPGYFDMKWGDVIRSYWAGQPGPVHTVLAEELIEPAISLSFDRTYLESLEDGEVAVTYTVTDRAGNTSVVSQAASVVLRIKNTPTDLLPPMVPQADDGLIDDTDGRQGVRVDIPAYTHAEAGDAITLLWGRVALPEYRLTAAEIGQAVLFSMAVAYPSLVQAGDGKLEVRYEVRREGQLLATSPSLEVQVFLTVPGPQDDSPHTLINEALAAPVIKGRSDNANRQDNVLDEDDYLLSADAVIAWREGFKRCDQINLFWGASTVPVMRPINQNDVDAATDLLICLPNRVITAEGVCKPVSVRYTVTHAGNPNTSYSPSQPVKLVSKGQLPGGETGLGAPLFIQANAYCTLEPADSPDGTAVHITPYRNMQVGDVIQLSFTGFDAMSGGNPVVAASDRQEQVVSDNDLLKGCRFMIAHTCLLAIQRGRAEARYEVINTHGQASSLKAGTYVDMRTPAPGC